MSSSIFKGNKIKLLKQNLTLNDAVDIQSGTVDPTSSAVDAPLGSLYLNTSNGLAYRKLDAGSSTNWSIVGSSSASGINYVTNSNAEANTSGWATYADAAAAVPVDMTGGSPTVTFTRVTSTPLRGIASFLFTKDAANRQGEGVSYAFTLENADKAKIIQISFDYEIASGTFATGDLAAYVYDVTNSQIIQPVGYQVQSLSGSKGRHTATFQTSSSGSSYRVGLHVASTSASAYTVKLDNVSVGPQVTDYGAPISDWISFTPTGSWSSNTTYAGLYRRVGADMEIAISIALSGAPTGTLTSVNMPTGFSVDTSKIPTYAANTNIVGLGSIKAAGTANLVADIYVASATTLGLGVLLASGTYVGPESAITATVPATFASGDYIKIYCKVPILGWASSVSLSQSDTQRVVSMRAVLTTAQTGVTSKVIPFNSATIDTHNALNTSTGVYTVPVPGLYRVSALAKMDNADSATDAVIRIRKNGNTYAESAGSDLTGTLTSDAFQITDVMSCLAGDTIDVTLIGDASFDIDNNGTRTVFSIDRLSGNQTISATELVSVKVSGSAMTGTIASSFGSSTAIAWGAVDQDTHGIYSSGSFTIPVSGTYEISGQIRLGHASVSVGQLMELDISLNGSQKQSGASVVQSTSATTVYIPLSGATFALVAGDVIQFRAVSPGTTPAFSNSAAYNWASIVRIGS